MTDWKSPYQYAKDKGLRPQILYYLVRSRGAPHKVIDGKLMVEQLEFDSWFEDYVTARFTRAKNVKHQHGPDCTEGLIPESPNGVAPTTAEHFKYIMNQTSRKASARRSAKRSVAEFDELIADIQQVEG